NRLFEANGGDRILGITNELGQAKTFANGPTYLNAISGIAFDNAGNLWAANLGGWIAKFDALGNGTKVYTNNLQSIRALVFDSAGNLYASGGSTVLKFDTQGNRTTYATISLGGSDNAYGMAFDSAGNLYVASP